MNQAKSACTASVTFTMPLCLPHSAARRRHINRCAGDTAIVRGDVKIHRLQLPYLAVSCSQPT